MKRFITLVIAAVIVAAASPLCMAQNFRVHGMVVEDESGRSLPNATVTVKGTSVSVQTNNDGFYVINVPTVTTNKKLIATYPGCHDKKEPVRETVIFRMQISSHTTFRDFLSALADIVTLAGYCYGGIPEI